MLVPGNVQRSGSLLWVNEGVKGSRGSPGFSQPLLALLEEQKMVRHQHNLASVYLAGTCWVQEKPLALCPHPRSSQPQGAVSKDSYREGWQRGRAMPSLSTSATCNLTHSSSLSPPPL